MTVVSLDLAVRSYADNGLALLRSDSDTIHCDLIPLSKALSGEPTPDVLADHLHSLATEVGSNVILIDGPQAWKSPNTDLEHQRVCEKALRTPGKTGLPGSVKPRTWTRFVHFSVALFDALGSRGWLRQSAPRPGPPDGRSVYESFPTAAWRSLGLSPLPSKAKANAAVVREHLGLLSRIYPLSVNSTPTHDELQAIVSGIAGIALESAQHRFLESSGSPPFRLEGSWREGYIVCPALPPGIRRVRRPTRPRS